MHAGTACAAYGTMAGSKVSLLLRRVFHVKAINCLYHADRTVLLYCTMVLTRLKIYMVFPRNSSFTSPNLGILVILLKYSTSGLAPPKVSNFAAASLDRWEEASRRILDYST